ncbi:MAG: hypothetical protein HGA78_00465 [Nitrospirales bacterium]|nr:hypothetical protein [Nitrospirales bacterium]
MRSVIRIAQVLSLILLLFASGCGYTLQSRANLPFQEIALGKIANKTPEPKLQDRLGQILAETLMEYGFRIRTDAPCRIEGDITGFGLRVVSEKGLAATEYEVSVEGEFRIIDRETGTVRTVSHLRNPFITSFNSTGSMESVIAMKDLASTTALRNLSQELVQEILSQGQDKR